MVKCSVAPSVRVLWLRKLLLYLVPLGSVSSSVSGAGLSVKHYFRITFPRRNFNALIINDLYFVR